MQIQQRMKALVQLQFKNHAKQFALYYRVKLLNHLSEFVSFLNGWRQSRKGGFTLQRTMSDKDQEGKESVGTERKAIGYLCPGCNRRFPTARELRYHRKEAHGMITPVGRSRLGASFASLGLRAFLGTVMMMHGLPKLTTRKEQTIQGMQRLGVPKPATLSASLLEVVGGASLLAGFLVPVVSSLFAAEMIGTTALSKKKMGKQFLSGGEKPSYELDVMYAAAFMILAVIGGGEFSVDRLLNL